MQTQTRRPAEAQAPEPQPATERAPDAQELYGNAMMAQMMEATNQRGSRGGDGTAARGHTPRSVRQLGTRAGGPAEIVAENLVGPETPEDQLDPWYEGLEIHEVFGTPRPIGLSSADSVSGSLSDLFTWGDTSRAFVVDSADTFIDYHGGGGLTDPARVRPEAWARGFSWEGQQHYTHEGQRLAGTFTIRRDLRFSGGVPSIVITKTQAG